MAEIGKAYVQIIPTAEGITGKVSKILGDEGQKGGKQGGQNFAAGIKNALMKIGIGAVLVKGVKEALTAGGALQQSFGGLETLYGDAADQAKKFAIEASKAGISANTYAEQAVSFGASLKAAFGGDTVKAAQAANTAIMDMADNSAKMGTDISTIQSAYQGLAKQNYTMLDNLKLGYGGTKTEMERLLKDAQKLSGVKYDINNLGDVYQAIHVIQENLGLTGVAAKEATETFSGSFNALKASLQNLMASLSLGDGVETAMQSVITSASAFLFNNLIPMLVNIVQSIPQALMTAIPTVWEQIKAQLLGILGGQSIAEFTESGFNLFMSWLTGFLNGLPQIMLTAGEVINNLIGGLMTRAPELLAKGSEMLMTLLQGIGQALPGIANAALQIISQLTANIATHLPAILQKGIEIILQLVAGLIRAIPKVVAAIPQIINTIRDSFTRFDWGSIGTNILQGIANGIKGGVGAIADAAKSAAQSALDAAKNFLGIHSPSKVMEEEVGRWIPAGIAEGITGNLSTLNDAMNDVNQAIAGEASANIVATYAGTGFDTGVNEGFGLGSGFVQNITINSPQELTPSEIARQTRNATRQMALSMTGVY